jgi:DNA (cytosine-5)-methyltransferase 1
LGGADEPGLAQRPLETDQPPTLRIEGATFGAAEPLRGFWSGADWLYCRDGKYRPVEPGTFPLASRAPGRVGRLRGYGNALCAPAAQAFIEAARGICGAVEDLFEGKGLSRG